MNTSAWPREGTASHAANSGINFGHTKLEGLGSQEPRDI